MRIIQIAENELGGHLNQETTTDVIVPEGWAVIPDDMAIPETFPFVRITVRNGVVKSMVAGTMPPDEPVTPQPTADDILNALLGVTE